MPSNDQPQLWKNWYFPTFIALLIVLFAVVAYESSRGDTKPHRPMPEKSPAVSSPNGVPDSAGDAAAADAAAARSPRPTDTTKPTYRDAIRVAQLNDLSVAIGEYAKQHGSTYPAGTALSLGGKRLCTVGWRETCETAQPVSRLTAADIAPPAPAKGTACTAAQNGYVYTSSNWNTWFKLRFCLEVGTDKLKAGYHTLTPLGYDAAMPTSPDPDGDGLNDGRELQLGTNPRVADTDLDGTSDGAEVTAGTDPLTNAQSGKKTVAP